MIHQAAIRKFLSRKLDDFRYCKTLSDDEINDNFMKLPVRPPLWNRLRRHQKIGFLVGACMPRFAFWYDLGTGKTLLAIALVRYFQLTGDVKRVLVLVPNLINKEEWAREIAKHSPSTMSCILSGGSQDKWAQLQNTDALIVIESYFGLVHMVASLVKVKDKNKLQLERGKVQRLLKLVDGVILDESWAVKSARSLAFRVCRQLSKTCSVVFALSGTPFGRDPLDLWSQMFLVDRGETLGVNKAIFLASFFRSKPNYFGGMEHTFDRHKQSLLHRMLAHRSLRYMASQADLPAVVSIRKRVNMSSDAKDFYSRAVQAIRAAGGNYREMKNAFLRMRQISSGFVGYYDDDLGQKASLVFKENPKLDMLLSLLESIPSGRKTVIFVEFVYSGKRIAAELQERKIGHVLISGESRNVDVDSQRFMDDPNCRVTILSNRMVTGLNFLQVAQYMIFFESPVSALMRKQARRRVERQENKHGRVFLYDLLAGSVDERILEFHRHGEDLFQAIIENRATL